LKRAQQAFLSFPRRDATNLIAVDILAGALDVETAMRANGRKPDRRRPYLAPIRIAPLKEAVLDGLLCISARAQKAITIFRQPRMPHVGICRHGISRLKSQQPPIREGLHIDKSVNAAS
jgi:hypothetical protein